MFTCVKCLSFYPNDSKQGRGEEEEWGGGGGEGGGGGVGGGGEG